MDTRTYLTKLERNLMTGTGHWIADFTESFRDFALEGITFDMFVKGNTRAKGFLMSRVTSFLLTPNYYVACFAYSGPFEPGTLPALTRSILDYLTKREMTWAWLVLVLTETPSAKLRKQVENWNQRELPFCFAKRLAVYFANSYLSCRSHLKIMCRY